MKNKTKVIVTLAGLVTISIHVLNRVQYSLTTAKKILEEHTDNEASNTYEWRFGKIHYEKKGSGTPLLLLHDLTNGSSNYEYHRIFYKLAEKHEVYSIDLLGYGFSDKPNMTYTNYLYVQLVIDFIKNVIGHKTNIIATGDSAPIAIMACHNDPEVFNRLIFINPQSLYNLNQIPSKHTKLFKLLIEFPIIGTFTYNILTSRTLMEKEFGTVYYYDKQKIHEKDINAYLEAAHISDYHSKFTFASYVGKYMNANIIHSLKEIDHSMFILGGAEKEDNQNILENYRYYNNSIETNMIADTRQLPQLEAPDETLAQIEFYLEN